MTTYLLVAGLTASILLNLGLLVVFWHMIGHLHSYALLIQDMENDSAQTKAQLSALRAEAPTEINRLQAH